MSALRTIFMGTPDFAVPTLSALLDAGHEVVAVYAQPPRPVGRGHHEKPAPVHAFAEQKGLSVRTPVSLKGDDEQQAFIDLDADVAVVAASGKILPKAVIEAPRLGCLNVHASLLPRWRGAAPVQRAILAGDEVSGVTIMQINEDVDAGDILLSAETPIGPHTTATDLHDRLSAIGAELLVEALDGMVRGSISPIPQPSDGVTYAAKLERNEGRLDWARPAIELERTVRALNPWPGVWFDHAGERIKVLAADVLPEAGGEPGTVISEPLAVACGDGALALKRLQRPGKGPLDTETFLRGYPLTVGTRLG